MIKTLVGTLEVLDNKIVHVTQGSDLSIIIDNITILFTFIND